MLALRFAASLPVALWMARRGLKKGSLAPSGAAAAAAMGTVHLASGLQYGLTLILFYVTSSKLTHWRSDLKARLEEGHVAGRRRGAAQVLANSGLGGCLAAAAASLRAAGNHEPWTTAAQLGFVGFYACCCADTWSSEVGITSSAPPRLVTTGQVVPPGTNGGVSLLGIAAAAAGGVLMGACYWSSATLSAWLGDSGSGNGSIAAAGSDTCQAAAAGWGVVPLALAAGIGGSLLDSLLAAMLQYSGLDERNGRVVSGRPPAGSAAATAVRHISGRDVLSNTEVNVVASLLISALVAAAGARLLPDGSC